jgi:hypothetical protein
MSMLEIKKNSEVFEYKIKEKYFIYNPELF